MDADTKERLVEEFRVCLEDWGAADLASGEGPVLGAPVDLALLFAELSVLRNEVRVEARQFKAALDDMRALADMLSEQNHRLARDLERAREAEGAEQRKTERLLLLDLLDVRDRIGSAMDIYFNYEPGYLARFAAREMQLIRGVGDGIEMTLRRIDALLTERHVRPLEAVGGRLDPNTMRAIGTDADASRAAGEVLSEARRGYMRDDELLRLAEVIVNKPESQA
ncbi:MAG: nucleotide exchange factor GrpE [Betaproteobacteria bacterium]